MPDKPPLFQPDRVQHCTVPSSLHAGAGADRRDGRDYVYHEPKIELAVNVALATGRPLLVSGPSGSGKSTLALNVALYFGWRFYEFVVTSRTEARDLLWRFDHLRRLNDARPGAELKDEANYLDAGVLWWALDPLSATRRGARADEKPPEHPALDPCGFARGQRAVILIDEIDKAEIDVPNNLLVPLGSLQFEVEPLGRRIPEGTVNEPPLILITTNKERELPPAFLRRCVALDLPAPTNEKLLEIAEAVMSADEQDPTLFRAVAEQVLRIAKEDGGISPSTAEYLDTLRACQHLKIPVKAADGGGKLDPRFEQLLHITVRKGQSALPR